MLYYDNAATTRVDKSLEPILQSMFFDNYGNPSSVHTVGQYAKEVIERARELVAISINCAPDEIIFTSGGSESNNLALKGFSFANDCEIITTPIEHKSILETCKFLEKQRINKYYLVGVDEEGVVLEYSLKARLQVAKDSGVTPLVSIQLANSEIGTIQPIKEIAELVHSFGGVLHVDAVQAYFTIEIDVKDMGIDMLSVSGHKIGLPKGIGFLYKKNSVKIEPLIHGGGQEHGLRAGTENTAYIAAWNDKLCRDFSEQDIGQKAEQLYQMRTYLEKKLLKIPDSRINGAENKLPGNINISFKGIDGETLMMLLDTNDLEVSNGSACNAGNPEPSYVLKAIKVPDDYINGTIRITIAPKKKSNSYRLESKDFAELDMVADKISKYVNILRKVR